MGNKHYEDLINDNKNPSIFLHPHPQKLLNEYGGTGIKAPCSETIVGMAGHTEIVDFKEFIGYSVDRHTKVKTATTLGKIHYTKEGAHIVPYVKTGDFMKSPISYILISLQDTLGNCVTPELRAITFNIDEKKRGVRFYFFYDAEITYELEENVDILMLEVADTKELDVLSYEVIQLDSSKQIPIHGELAFLRYEKELPKFERKCHAFLVKEKDYPRQAIYRLDMQQALLGRVTPALRHVGVDADPNIKKLIAHFIYDGEISELNRQLASSAIEDSRISFPDYQMESYIERIDYPNKMNHHGKWLAYWRQEWIFTDDGPIPSIHK